MVECLDPPNLKYDGHICHGGHLRNHRKFIFLRKWEILIYAEIPLEMTFQAKSADSIFGDFVNTRHGSSGHDIWDLGTPNG